MSSIIYLDNAATTAVLPEVYEAMQTFFKHQFGNPSSIYSLGRETKMHIEQARASIAQELSCKRGEIVFTSSGTESINKVLLAAVIDLQCTCIISSKIEHHATLHTIEYLQKKYGITVKYINLYADGNIDYQHLEELLKSDSQKTMLSLLHANNEIGTLSNMATVSNLCKQYKTLLHFDTVQTIAHYKINLEETPIDFLSCSAHKFHGPKGSGFVYINTKNKISPLFFGGGQERNMRAGTENVAGIIGLMTAFEIAYKNLESNQAYILNLKKYMYEEIIKQFENVRLFGDQNFDNALYTVLNIGFPKSEKTEMLAINLDLKGICVSSGSACSSGSENGSHVIAALQGSNEYQPIRFSFSILNTLAEIDVVLKTLKSLLA